MFENKDIFMNIAVFIYTIYCLFTYVYLFVSDRPTQVRIGIYVNSFYSISEQTMVS